MILKEHNRNVNSLKGANVENYTQQEMFSETVPAPSAPESAMWNLWHGCTRVSTGCAHCYVYRRDAEFGRDTSEVHKTQSFTLPVRKYRSGPRKGEYKYPAGTVFYTCFTSDFFHPAADGWRGDAWRMMRERSDCSFYMVTKRPERIRESLPPDWGDGYENVEICCTCENQKLADERLPIFLELPIAKKTIMHEPMLERINIRPYLRKYAGQINCVTCGGESGPEARICDYAWVLDSHLQCVEYGVSFHFHQTGARFRRGSRIYDVPREFQRDQARKAQLDFRVGSDDE